MNEDYYSHTTNAQGRNRNDDDQPPKRTPNRRIIVPANEIHRRINVAPFVRSSLRSRHQNGSESRLAGSPSADPEDEDDTAPNNVAPTSGGTTSNKPKVPLSPRQPEPPPPLLSLPSVRTSSPYTAEQKEQIAALFYQGRLVYAEDDPVSRLVSTHERHNRYMLYVILLLFLLCLAAILVHALPRKSENLGLQHYNFSRPRHYRDDY
jgi:hypothetical protein